MINHVYRPPLRSYIWIYALPDCIYNTLLEVAWHQDYLFWLFMLGIA
jgi:hypothetical protein